MASFFSPFTKLKSPVPPTPKQSLINNLIVKFSVSPVGRAIERTQRFIESPTPTRIVPEVKPFAGRTLPQKAGNIVSNIPGSIVNTVVGRGILDPMIDVGRTMGTTISGRQMPTYESLKSPHARIGYQIGEKIRPDIGKITPQTGREYAGNIAGTLEAPATVYGGGKLFGFGKQAVESVGKQTVKQVLLSNIKKGGVIGGVHGAISGLSEGRTIEDDREYARTVAGRTIGGAAVGSVLAGAFAGGGYAAGKIREAAAKALSRIKPGISPQQAQKEASIFLRDELGRFSGRKGTAKEPVYYGDLRESLGLPRHGNYQRGEINFAALTGEKGNLGENVKYNAALQVEGIAQMSNDPAIPKGAGDFIRNVNTTGAKTPQEAADIIIRSLPKEMRSSETIVKTIADWGKTIQTAKNYRESIKPTTKGLLEPFQKQTEASVAQTSLPVSSTAKPQQSASQQPTAQQTAISGAGQTGTTSTPSQTVPPSSSEGIVTSLKNKVNKLYTETLDRFHPISLLGKKAGKDQEMRNALTGHYGAGSTASYHVDFQLKPILKEQKIGDLRDLAIVQRDLELAGRGIQGSNTGLTMDTLRARMGDAKLKEAQGTLNKLYKYQDDIVQEYLVKTGIISKESYAAMRKNNQFYVPFKRVMDDMDDFLGMTPPTKGAGSVSSQNVVYRMEGSKRKIIDPIESIMESTYKAVGLGKRQQVAQTIVSLKDKLPQGMVQKIEGKVGNHPNIALFENGKVQHYRVPQEVADAAKGMNEESMNTIIKILNVPTRVFRATATGVNPEFAVPNVARDLQSAFVNVGMNPMRWVRGLAHLIRKDDMYQEFLKSGGKTSRISLDRPFLKKSVEDITGKKAITVVKPSNLYKILENVGELSEQPTRIAVFERELKKQIKNGLTREEAAIRAANAAQEATVNFARRGSAMAPVNAIYAFLNARMQGTDRLVRSIKNDPAGATTRLAMITMAPAMALYAWNRKYPSYKDDRIISENDKRNNFIIMLSEKPIPQLGGAQYLKIPKGDVGKLATPVERFLSYLDGHKESAGKEFSEFLKAFSPIEDVGGLIPTAIRPPVEVAANKNFFTGFPIVPEYKTKYPAEYQYSSYTSPTYRMIGDKLGIAPAKIQAIVEGYGTGIARMADYGARNLMSPFMEKKYTEGSSVDAGSGINRAPVIRRILGGEKKTEEEFIESQTSPKATFDRLMKLDRETATRYADKIAEDRPDFFKQLMKEKTYSDAGLSDRDRSFAGMGVKSGDRARAVYDELQKKKTKEEKIAYVDKLIESKIITDDVFDQLKELLAQ